MFYNSDWPLKTDLPWFGVNCIIPHLLDLSMPMDLFKLSQVEISEVPETESCRQPPQSPGYLSPISSFSSPLNRASLTTSLTGNISGTSSQCPLLEVSGIPQRPEAVFYGEYSKASSCYGTTACNTPSRWSFSEKGKDRIDTLAVSSRFQYFPMQLVLC